jgi:branched-chain amino acid transport system substrate-binding protein
MKRVISLVVLAAMMIGLVIGVSGCGDSQTIRVGFMAQLSGPDSYVGQTAKLALEDYVSELNAKGGLLGKQVEVITYDTRSDAAECVNVAKRLIEQDHVVAIIGPEWTGGAVPLAPIVDAAKVPLIATTATNPKVTVDEQTGQVYPFMFRVSFIDPYQGTALADYAYNKLGLRRVAFLTDVGSAFSVGIQDYFTQQFTKLGGQVVANAGYQANDVEFRSQLATIRATSPDALCVPSATYRDAALVAKQARALGLNVQMLGVDGWVADELLSMAGPELQNAIITSGASNDDPAFQAYNDAFAAKHPGQRVNIYAYYALDAFRLIQHGIESTGKVDGAAIADAIANAKDVQVFTGKLTYEPTTHNPHNKPVQILRIDNSKWTLVTTYEPK